MKQLKRATPFAGLFLVAALTLTGCAGTSSTAGGGTSAQPTVTETATATPAPGAQCAQLLPGATPFAGISGISGLNFPTGTYVTSPNYTGGGAGEYRIASYTVCFQGSQSQIIGNSSSTFAQLQSAGWLFNNLFPDPSSFTYIDYCSNDHNCFNSTGKGNPFTFIGFQQYTTPAAGYTTFSLQIATISAPSCLNDPNYYSGTPTYTLYENSLNKPPTSGAPEDKFYMPPATRVSTYQGGGTAGSTYVYFCSAGSAPQIVQFLADAMSNVGWTISAAASAGFTAEHGSNPTYRIDLSITNANNYYLRIYVPM